MLGQHGATPSLSLSLSLVFLPTWLFGLAVGAHSKATSAARHAFLGSLTNLGSTMPVSAKMGAEQETRREFLSEGAQSGLFDLRHEGAPLVPAPGVSGWVGVPVLVHLLHLP